MLWEQYFCATQVNERMPTTAKPGIIELRLMTTQLDDSITHMRLSRTSMRNVVMAQKHEE